MDLNISKHIKKSTASHGGGLRLGSYIQLEANHL
ncbi:hypothetical protein SAMN05428961_10171 [Paenibacillus sp. OK060]|nr:hypothetical protein SAMN05428961_10171 [Paenibacillus sp. OK060]